jgi:hypothetical protein
MIGRSPGRKELAEELGSWSFCSVEKPQVRAINRTAPILPMLPTSPQRASHDYERNGTVDLSAALEVATGKVITDLRARHTSADFAAFLNH